MKQTMDINRETAKRLWNKFYGKKLTVVDFSGRKMIKAAYNDRNSAYGWNLDHILPQSRGGKNADHNLVCTNIATNDEKADKFPCFTANQNRFEIIKVQNHYEIKMLNETENQEEQDDDVNFYDSAAGIRFFKQAKGMQNKKPFVGVIKISLTDVTTLAVVDFVQAIFEVDDLTFNENITRYASGTARCDVNIIIINRNVETQKTTQDLLDDCVLLNTYFQYYFIPEKVIANSSIYYELVECNSKSDALTYNNNRTRNSTCYVISSGISNGISSKNLVINEIVRFNTDAKEKHEKSHNGLYVHDYHFTNLKKNLEKETSR